MIVLASWYKLVHKMNYVVSLNVEVIYLSQQLWKYVTTINFALFIIFKPMNVFNKRKLKKIENKLKCVMKPIIV